MNAHAVDRRNFQQRSSQLFTLALPIIAALISQSIINLVDTAMVGRLGADALAGTGLGGYANFVGIALVIGLGGGVQAVVSRRYGEKRFDKLSTSLNAGLLISLVIGIPLTLIYYFLAPLFMPLLSGDSAVDPIATEYFQARIIALVAVAGNFCFRGFWNGINQSKIYMRTLIAMHVINVIASYSLIFGAFGMPEIGAKGAGIGTTIAMFSGLLMYFVQAMNRVECPDMLRKMPLMSTIKDVARIALPNSVQQLFFSLGLLALFAILATIGTAEVAAAHIIINLILFLILPGLGMGISAASLAGQALGASDPELAHRWGWDSTFITAAFLFILSMPMWLAPSFIVSIFTKDASVIAIARLPLIITGFTIFYDALALVFSNTLVGVGNSKAVMFTTLFSQWLLFLPCAIIGTTYLGFGLLGVWLLYLSQRFISSSLMAYIWYRRRWVDIKL